MAYNSICILGRQPALGRAELEALYGAAAITDVSWHAAGLELEASAVDFRRLGGSTKLAKVIGIVESTNWKLIEKALISVARSTTATNGLEALTTGKFNIGISAIGLDVTPAKLTALGLTLKKILRTDTRSARIVPNQVAELSTAQVYHNHLTDERGAEIVLVKARDGSTIVARTVAVQDIDSYTLRDRGRPKRDARVGMLPPKLAQIIINLAVGSALPSPSFTVLDPFCGTGVVLIETLLMGYSSMGSDIDQRMIDYTSANLTWAATTFPQIGNVGRGFQRGDATTHRWLETKFISKNGEAIDAKMVPLHIDAVAGETYLGRPFTAVPARETLEQTVSDVNTILKKFLTNIHAQLTPGTRLCLGIPAWQTAPNRFRHLPLIDQLSELGYSRVDFTHAKAEDLVYYREDQIVGRELLVLNRR